METKKYAIKNILIIIFSILFSVKTSLAANVCLIKESVEKAILELPYKEFDQTPNGGWRPWANNKNCYLKVADILDNYVKTNEIKLEDWQARTVRWHSGQLYGFANEYKAAKERFLASLNPNEPENTPILWNVYVHATIAFLDKDLSGLNKYQKVIANGPSFNGGKANLEVVDRLIANFNRPYEVAYRSQ